jgi:hypothetical protein
MLRQRDTTSASQAICNPAGSKCKIIVNARMPIPLDSKAHSGPTARGAKERVFIGFRYVPPNSVQVTRGI